MLRLASYGNSLALKGTISQATRSIQLFQKHFTQRTNSAKQAAAEALQEETLFTYRAPRSAKFKFVTKSGKEYKIHAPFGKRLHVVALDAKIEELPMLCNGQMQCTTCHIRGELPGAPSEAELDLLVTAPEYANGSRLACQVLVCAEMEGKEIIIPDVAENRLDKKCGHIRTSEWNKYIPDEFRSSESV